MFLFCLLLKDFLKSLIKGAGTENNSGIIISKERVAPALPTTAALLVFNLFPASSPRFLLFSAACFGFCSPCYLLVSGAAIPTARRGFRGCRAVLEKGESPWREEESCLPTLKSIGCDSLDIRSGRTDIEMMYCPLKRYGLELSPCCTRALAACKMEGCKCWAHPRVLYSIIDCLSKQHTNLSDTKCRLWGHVLLSGLAARKKQGVPMQRAFSLFMVSNSTRRKGMEIWKCLKAVGCKKAGRSLPGEALQ